jgi:hypothetical protein
LGSDLLETRDVFGDWVLFVLPQVFVGNLFTEVLNI